MRKPKLTPNERLERQTLEDAEAAWGLAVGYGQTGNVAAATMHLTACGCILLRHLLAQGEPSQWAPRDPNSVELDD